MNVIHSKVNAILVLSHKNSLDNKMLDLILKDIDKNSRDIISALMGKQDINLFQLIEKYGITEKKF